MERLGFINFGHPNCWGNVFRLRKYPKLKSKSYESIQRILHLRKLTFEGMLKLWSIILRGCVFWNKGHERWCSDANYTVTIIISTMECVAIEKHFRIPWNSIISTSINFAELVVLFFSCWKLPFTLWYRIWWDEHPKIQANLMSKRRYHRCWKIQSQIPSRLVTPNLRYLSFKENGVAEYCIVPPFIYLWQGGKMLDNGLEPLKQN